MTGRGLIRRRIDVSGIVQGVGFRPYVYGLAQQLALAGWVENNPSGVRIEIEGPAELVDDFVEQLPVGAPPLAAIEELTVSPAVVEAAPGFRILESRRSGPTAALVAPDVAPCSACLREIRTPQDRRFGYAFTNCTNCGPRYSIMTDIPYDRPNTTMSAFTLCRQCELEYSDPTDRRFHAQPVCCPACGPRLSITVDQAAASIRRGMIVAVKGVGGYHLTTLARDAAAVADLRGRKHREDKPFAIMVGDLRAAEQLCSVTEAEAGLLASPQRPIVLLPRRSDAAVAPTVAPFTTELGLMLPSSPLHQQLLDAVEEPIVCTSGNRSDEPIAFLDDDATNRLAPIADVFLSNDRPIRTRVDDSVYRVVDEQPYPIRRSRGFAPAPLMVPWPAARPVLALGADLKNTIAFHRGRHVFVSHHIGDLDDFATFRSFTDAIAHLGRLLDIEPAVAAFDLHPDYRSSRHGAELDDFDHVAVQHHHAHIASCLADAGRQGPVIGVAFDGLGYGDDGTFWGGEFLLADLVGYDRRAWFAPVPMPGGDQAARQPWRMAAVYLDALGEADRADLAVAARCPRWDDVLQLARTGTRSPLTSSVGRLFDAVASLLGVRDEVSYEGQAAIELEQIADRTETIGYRPVIDEADDRLLIRGDRFVADVVRDLRAGVPEPVIAARFHNGIADAVVATCEAIRDQTGTSTVALSGGVFLNRLVLTAAQRGLRQTGFEVLRHRQVPCNDGGISLGQAVIVAARDRAGERGAIG